MFEIRFFDMFKKKNYRKNKSSTTNGILKRIKGVEKGLMHG